jgi:hypothetical protein
MASTCRAQQGGGEDLRLRQSMGAAAPTRQPHHPAAAMRRRERDGHGSVMVAEGRPLQV